MSTKKICKDFDWDSLNLEISLGRLDIIMTLSLLEIILGRLDVLMTLSLLEISLGRLDVLMTLSLPVYKCDLYISISLGFFISPRNVMWFSVISLAHFLLDLPLNISYFDIIVNSKGFFFCF